MQQITGKAERKILMFFACLVILFMGLCMSVEYLYQSNTEVVNSIVRHKREEIRVPWEKDNSYIEISKIFYKASGVNQSCWVCGFVPHTADTPYIGYPYTKSEISQELKNGFSFIKPEIGDYSDKTRRLTLINTADQGGLWVQRKEGENLVGDSKLNLSSTCVRYNFTDYESDGYFCTNDSNELNVAEKAMWAPSNDNCRNHSLPRSIYWLCGKWAYRILPCNWKGSCYLGRVLPAFTIRKDLPNGRLRNRRRVNVKTSTTENVLLSIFPQIGVGLALKKINELAEVLDSALNYSSDAISKLNAEQIQIRMMALQNRMALDYILASKGGVCALVKDHCCVFIKDRSGEIETDLDKIGVIQKKLHQVNEEWDPFGLERWLGSLGAKLVTGMIVALFVIVCVYVFCLLIKSLSVKCTGTSHAMPLLEGEESPDFKDPETLDDTLYDDPHEKEVMDAWFAMQRAPSRPKTNY